VSIRNRCLMDLSVMKRRPVAVVQTFAAADVCCVSFPAGCRCRAGNSFAPGFQSVGGTSRFLKHHVGVTNVESRTPHRMFVVLLEMATSGSWYGQDQDRRCTGRVEERCCTGLNEECCDLYWAGIGPVRLGGRDATRALS
jgi:hypothetical protein